MPPIAAINYPLLSPAVPTRLVRVHDYDYASIIATVTAEEGWLTSLGEHPLESIGRAHERYLASLMPPALSDCRLLTATEPAAQTIEPFGMERMEEDLEDRPVIGLVSDDNLEIYLVGEELSALHKVNPAAALTVINCLCDHPVLHTVSSMDLLDMCSQMYWQGENDETMAMKEMQKCGGDYEILAKAQILTEVPAWVFTARKKAMPVKRFLQLTAEAFSPQQWQLITACQDYLRLCKKIPKHFNRFAHGLDTMPYFLFRWTDKDELCRVTDDIINSAQSGEGISYSHWLTIFDDAATLRQAHQALRLAYQLVEALLKIAANFRKC